MKMLKLILALSCAVIVCECMSEVCLKVDSCNWKLLNLLKMDQEMDVEQLCQKALKFKECVASNKEQCNDKGVTEDCDNLIRSEEIICSVEGKEVSRKLKGSDCETDAIKKGQIEAKIGACREQWVQTSDLAPRCRYEAEYAACYKYVWTENACVPYNQFLGEFIFRRLNPWIKVC